MKYKERPEQYVGTLDHAKMAPEARRAYISWRDQRQRCYNQKSPRYRHVGGKGVTVDYTAREFIAWWLEQIQTREHWNRPTCGRLDHSKPYRFDNIELQEMAENVAERNRRYPGERQDLLAVTDTGLRLLFKSIQEAARVLRIKEKLLADSVGGIIEVSHHRIHFDYVKTRR